MDLLPSVLLTENKAGIFFGFSRIKTFYVTKANHSGLIYVSSAEADGN
jgi:hypothetical protein